MSFNVSGLLEQCALIKIPNQIFTSVFIVNWVSIIIKLHNSNSKWTFIALNLCKTQTLMRNKQIR